jgi:20S proteasome alpha/beta subunit
LTTVIGLKYQNGILLFSDTQESVPTNTGYSRGLFQGKLYPIGDNRCAIGCAGRSADIDKFVNYISLEFKGEQYAFPYEDNELYSKLNKLVLNFIGGLKVRIKNCV